MKKILSTFLSFFIFSFGYAQFESKYRICFCFTDQYGSIIKPSTIEITDNEGNFFHIYEERCYTYPSISNYVFALKVQNDNYYDYEKTYHLPIPEIDTIVLRNIESIKKFFIKSEISILTDNEITFLTEVFSGQKYGFTSLSLEINVGKYDISEFHDTIVQIYDLYVHHLLDRNSCNSIDFSVSFRKDNSENVLYLFEGHGIR
jgi:hypothetical protein